MLSFARSVWQDHSNRLQCPRKIRIEHNFSPEHIQARQRLECTELDTLQEPNG